MKRPSSSIVIRLMALTTALVLSMAMALYFALGYNSARMRDAERNSRMRFLVTSISFGIRNFVVTNRADLIGDVVSEALNRNNDPELVVSECKVRNNRGKILFEFNNPPPPGMKTSSTSAVILNTAGAENQSIGTIKLKYYAREQLESEKTRQIITIGNTLAAMFQVFYRNKALFQAKELVETVRQDPNILYCLIIGENGEVHFAYHSSRGKIENRLTRGKQQKAMSVNHAMPIVIQDIARTPKLGRVIEASILIEEGNKKLGVVRIGYSLRSWDERIARTRTTMMILIAAFAILAFGLSYYLSKSITGPIVQLTGVARDVTSIPTAHELDVSEAEYEMSRIAVSFENIAARLHSRRDEVGDLADAFSSMITRLQTRAKELRQAYQKVSQADRLFAMGQLAAGIAHEINNPLAIISTYVQIIDKRPGLDDELKGELRIINEEIQRIAEKVKDLLSFAQDPEIRFAPADLAEITRRTLSLMRHQFKKCGIELVDALGEEAPAPVVCDANKIKQVVLNLAMNAMQAMTEGGILTVGLRDEGQRITLYVRDTGHGIAEEDLPKIFNPFFTRRKIGEGTGMGLAICYSIVESHKGEIDVISSPGNGTEFIVRLPKETA